MRQWWRDSFRGNWLLEHWKVHNVRTPKSAVLSFAEPLRDVSGVRWTLTADSRKAVLNEAIGTDELSASLKRTANQFSDPLSNALRTWLSRQRDRANLRQPGGARKPPASSSVGWSQLLGSNCRHSTMLTARSNSGVSWPRLNA